MAINSFNSKTELYNYIIKKFPNSKLILLSGSMVSKRVKHYSDFDMEIHSVDGASKRPYYELIFVSNKLCLLTIYFVKFFPGKSIKPPKDKKVIFGDYNNHYHCSGRNTYNVKQKIKRENQLILDIFFKYVRHKEKKYLEWVAKRI